MTATLKTHTLGCRVNQYETELVRQALHGAGFRDAAADELADLCVVNTCTVTAEGDAKSRQTIRQMARRNPQARIVVMGCYATRRRPKTWPSCAGRARIVVMGCYATRAPDEVAALPNVVDVITDKRELPDLLGRFGVIDMPTGISAFDSRQRAYVKVQDGCMLSCSFCIIPRVRPHLASRPPEHIIEEVGRLVDAGHREIVLTGIHLGHYGVEWSRSRPKHEWRRLSWLLDRLAPLPGEFRIRLSSIEATEVTRELIAVMAEHRQRVCPHLHVSMQSGSDDVLRRMRRRWGSRRFLDRCSLVRQSLDEPALTTDIIVGFPGETEDDFLATCRVVREVGFSKIHIFPFSPRQGTLAATLPDQICPTVKAERVQRLAELEAELRDDYYRRLVGRRLQVLVEGPAKTAGRAHGTSCRYAPVEFPASAAPRRHLVELVAETVADGQILAAAPALPVPAGESR